MPDNRLRILLVEDNNGDAVLVQEYIEEADRGAFVLRRAKTLATGLAALAEFKPQVVLLDLNLPDSKGFSTLEQLCREADASPPRPAIVVLTSYDDIDTAKRAIDGYAQDYLVKRDVNAQVLIKAIQMAVHRFGIEHAEKILQGPDHPDAGNQRDAQEILQRANRSAQITLPIGESDADPWGTGEMLLATGAKATEIVLSSLDGRLGALEQQVRSMDLGDARRELLWAQLEKLVIGNGKGPLAARLDAMEKFVRDAAVEARARKGGKVQYQVVIILLLLAWAVFFAWSVYGR